LLFNSWTFVVFFAVVYVCYLALRDFRWQNVLLLIASYYFYAAWDPRFLVLLLSSTVLDYVCALQIDRSENTRIRRAYLVASVVGNLSLLGFFKYYNFFLDSLDALLTPAGLSVRALHLDIVLPVGISFYTFQEMSYTIDVYRREMPAIRSFRDFALFVAFFPHMVAGPIMRASKLLVQFMGPRTITRDGVITGCWLILWGLWKKVVIADNMATIADDVFAASASVSWVTAYLGVVAFAFQIYADFSAYSDIARGVSRLLGIELMQNFDLPYFATSPSDFWRRWHISLSTWLRDYLYIPLGGNRGSRLQTYRNLMLTMLLGGIWHGAAWNYAWWGGYHGLLLVGQRLGGDSWAAALTRTRWRRIVAIVVMFQFTLFGWLLFRCTRQARIGGRLQDDSLRQILEMLSAFRNGLGFDATSLHIFGVIAAFALPLLLVQVLQYRTGNPFVILTLPRFARALAVALLLFSWLMWGVQSGTAFIYFQF
jgi:alginate O-acetyltransferase complex protein AlgI